MKKYYQKIKDLHFYIGLFISPFIVMFALSALVVNHSFTNWQDNWQDWFFSVNKKVDKTAEFTIPTHGNTDIDYAKDILNQINISGEIAGVFADSVQMYIPVTNPGHRISIRADIISGIVYIHDAETNLWKRMVWLHKMPGPHNANIRGNWIFTKIWALSVDFFVIFLLFSSITGIILWYYFKNERAIGLIALLVGFLSIVSLIIGLKV